MAVAVGGSGVAVAVGCGVADSVGTGVDVAVGSSVGVVEGVFEAVAVEVGSGALRARTASSTSMRGMSDTLPPGRVSSIGAPVLISAEATSSTVASGFFDFSTAQAPATCGAAIDVPLKLAKPLPGTEDVIEEPGASRSRKLATLENPEIVSLNVVDPTLMADEIQPGPLRAFGKPLFPEAITVATSMDRS